MNYIKNGIFFSDDLGDCVKKGLAIHRCIDALLPNTIFVSYEGIHSVCYTRSKDDFKEHLAAIGWEIEDCIAVEPGIGRVYKVCQVSDSCECCDIILQGF